MTIEDRIDAITNLTPDRAKAFAPIPKSVKIELTGRCNFMCSFCARGQRLREVKDMDWALYTRLVDQMAAAGVEELGVFYLGESFMVDWLPAAIKYAKQKGISYVFLTTNGSLATPDKVKECMEAGLDSLKFSLNYANEEQFEKIARVKKKNYKFMLGNLVAAHKVREEGNFGCTIAASYIMYDGEQGEKMQEVVESLRPYCDSIYALPLYNQASLIQGMEGEFVAGNVGRYDAMRAPLPCWSAFTEGHITWDGHLSACCFDHDGRFQMADLKQVSFVDGWNSLKFQELREAHLKKDVKGTACEQCVAWS